MQITSGKIHSAQKVVAYGPEGIGKSTLAAQFPDPLFIDTEGSTKHMDVARLPKPGSWAMLMEAVKYVKANPSVCKTLVIDTADWAEQLCIDAVCAKSQKAGIEDFGYGKGYIYLAEEFGRLLHALDDLIERGIGIALNCHAKMRKFELPDEMGAYDRWELKLSKTTAPLVKEWADMVLFVNYKTHVVNVDGQGTQKGKNKAQGGARVMYTSHHPCWDAKNRHGLKEELPLDFASIAHCFPAVVSATVQPAAPAPIEEAPAPVAEVAPPAAQKKTETAEPKGQERESVAQLRELMAGYNMTEAEIQGLVAQKGFFPADTPIENYPDEFINGWIFTVWEQICNTIMTARPTPF